MKLNIKDPDSIPDRVKAFHAAFCGNHKHMLDAMLQTDTGREIWQSTDRLAELIHLSYESVTPRRYVLKRLIQRYHRLASRDDIAAVWEK